MNTAKTVLLMGVLTVPLDLAGNLISTHPPMEERIAGLEHMVYGQGATR